MTTTLVAALRKKFPTKAKLLEALGVDQALLDEEIARSRKQLGSGPRLGLDAKGNYLKLGRDQEMPNGSAPAGTAARKLRLAIEEVLRGCEGGAGAGDVQRIIKLLEEHAPLGAGDEEDDPDLQTGSERRNGKDQEGGTELDKADLDRFGAYLRGKGIDEAIIEEALDMFPPNALPHGGALGRGAGPGAKFAARRVGMDERINKRLGIRLPDVGATAADHTIDRRPVLSRQGMDKLSRKFPGVESVIV